MAKPEINKNDRCIACRKPFRRWTERAYVPKGEKYRGNLQVVRKNFPPNMHKDCYEVWDGRRGSYDYNHLFCSGKCQKNFATYAVEKYLPTVFKLRRSCRRK